MAISHEYKCIFVHIPRTGGHTVSAVLGHRRNKEKDKIPRHAFPKDYSGTFPKEWNSYFKLTFVRNPWDRVVSAWTRARGKYLYLKKDKEKIYNDHWFKINIYDNFNNFVKIGLKDDYKKGRFKPQKLWLFRKPNKLYEYDFIGKFEDFNNEIKRLIKLTGIDYDINKIPTLASSNKRPYMEYYNKKSIDVVYSLYKKEIEFLGYEFGK